MYYSAYVLHPLVESDPIERAPARQSIPTAEAIAWLEDPQPPPPPETVKDGIARAMAEQLGWPIERVKGAIAIVHEYDPEKRKCLVSRQIKLRHERAQRVLAAPRRRREPC